MKEHPENGGEYTEGDAPVHDSPESRNKSVDLGNTLDYYNDDMSRKAVGKLFEDIKPADRRKPGGESLKADSEPDKEMELEAEHEPGREPDRDVDLEQEPEPALGGEPGREAGGYDTGQAQDEEVDIVRGFDKSDAPAREKGAGRETFANFDIDEEDDGYAFSLYRKKERKDAGRPVRSEPPEIKSPEERQPKAAKPQPPKPQPARPQPTKPLPAKPLPTRPQGKPEPRPEHKPEPSKPERPARAPYQSAAKTPPSIKTAELKAKRPLYHDDEDYDDFGPAPLPMKYMVAGGVIFVAVLLLATLVFQLSSAKSKLQKANEEIAAFADLEREYNQLTMENLDLKTKNEELQKQLDDLTAQPNPGEDPENPEDNGGAERTGAGQNAGQNAAATGFTNYTIEAGDNLSKISVKFYGNTSGVSRIQEANGMTGTDITAGQVIKIPQ